MATVTEDMMVIATNANSLFKTSSRYLDNMRGGEFVNNVKFHEAVSNARRLIVAATECMIEGNKEAAKTRKRKRLMSGEGFEVEAGTVADAGADAGTDADAVAETLRDECQSQTLDICDSQTQILDVLAR